MNRDRGKSGPRDNPRYTLGHTIRRTKNCTLSDPAKKILFIRPLEISNLYYDANTKYFPILEPIFMHGEKFVLAKKSIHFDQIKRSEPKFGEGLGKKYIGKV